MGLKQNCIDIQQYKTQGKWPAEPDGELKQNVLKGRVREYHVANWPAEPDGD